MQGTPASPGSFFSTSRLTCSASSPTRRPASGPWPIILAVPASIPPGRLDYDSEGLVVLTDAGWLQHRIADPAHKKPKTYWVQVEGIPHGRGAGRLASGVAVERRPHPARRSSRAWNRRRRLAARSRRSASANPSRLLARTDPAAKGRNRQVRRMTAAVGHPTLRLIRVRVGEWTRGPAARRVARGRSAPAVAAPAPMRNLAPAAWAHARVGGRTAYPSPPFEFRRENPPAAHPAVAPRHPPGLGSQLDRRFTRFGLASGFFITWLPPALAGPPAYSCSSPPG